MSGKLLQFLDDARNRVAGGAYRTHHRLESNGSLVAALDRPDAVIAELKPRSPSQGRLLTTRPEAVLQDYVTGGAAAISVLTDSDHFDGSLDLLAAAHGTGVPTLMKDFIVHEDQLDAARACGASAVLLIERCLGPERREDLVAAAHARGLEVLLEVHGSEEADAVLDSAAGLIGVNSRDLDTLTIDVPAAQQVVRSLVAAGRRVVALSGVDAPHGAAQARKQGAAILVGTHLIRSPDRVTALRALRRPLAKVCGLADRAGVDAAIDAGADLVGFIVGADSPRAIGAVQAQRLADHARAAGLSTVLVTTHTDDWEVREWCRVVRPTWVQLHGLRPSPEWIHSLQAIPTQVMFALRPDDEAPPGAGYVLDAPRPGSGQAHDWQAAGRRALAGPTLIAGGLDADNVAQALAASGAWGADASSRLELAPGRKDPAKVRAYVDAVHGGIP